MPPLSSPFSWFGQRHSRLAFFYAVPISILGGLIGLGGAEFRLPVLVGVLGYTVRQAVPLNLAISWVSIVASLLIRGRTLSFEAVTPFIPELLALVAGAMVTAFLGASLARRISNEQLERTVLVFLVVLGLGLIAEAFLPQESSGLIPADLRWRIPGGVGLGLVIGLVSSLLGVAGGEVIIPTLLFGFGVDIKTAGTASLLVSLPTVTVGLLRYFHRGALSDRRPLKRTVLPMGVGSVIGAAIGATLVGVVPSSILKVLLGLVLNLSALRVFAHPKPHPPASKK